MITATAIPHERKVVHALATSRIQSIDLLRGIVMIIMALDHVRDYFHAEAYLFNPLNLEQTTPAIFFMRWVTHYCAPIFVFLAGTSAFLVGQKKGNKYLTTFLLSRGIWLVIIELTVINFAWAFNVSFPILVLQVIWALGVGMVILAALIHLPIFVNVILGVLMVAGHNLLDGIHVTEGAGAIGWALLHEFRAFQLGGVVLFVGYPIIAWTGIMLLGYCVGTWYKKEFSAATRKKYLLVSGLCMIALFVALRSFNIYGDPLPWAPQKNAMYSLMSFLNVNKYPPSLLYALVTLGPALILLSLTESVRGRMSSYVIALGRVPMFYYIVHIYFIHALAIVAAMATGFEVSDMVLSTWVTDSPDLRGYGFSIGVVFILWIAVVLALFPLCLWYDRYKIANRDKWWLSYL